jgi:large conductance mechanosensitive channel
MSMVKEFKEFALKGNVVDMAVGIVIGAAFGKIVGSLVSDILMPPLGLAMGGVDFSKKAVILQAAVGDAPAVSLSYGLFLNNIINFVIVAFALFVVIKAMNKMKKKQAADPTPATAPADVLLLEEIRDILKKK